jgi:hypothetical protein
VYLKSNVFHPKQIIKSLLFLSNQIQPISHCFIPKKKKKSAKQKIPHHQNSSKIEYDNGRHRGKTNSVLYVCTPNKTNTVSTHTVIQPISHCFIS